jgi:hypothetical protein
MASTSTGVSGSSSPDTRFELPPALGQFCLILVQADVNDGITVERRTLQIV